MDSTESPPGRTRQVVGAFAGFGSVIKKVVVATFVLACTVIGLVLLSTLRGSEPPRDSVLVEQFRTRRAAFEELNRLLRDDVRLARVGEWGVATADSPIPEMPGTADFPRPRFERYLGLLKDAGAIAASRSTDSCPETCIHVWGWGWAAHTRHVSVCSCQTTGETDPQTTELLTPLRRG